MIIFKVGEIYECCRGGFQGYFMEVMNVVEVPVEGRDHVEFKVYDPIRDREFSHSAPSDVAELYGLVLWKDAPN